MAMVAVNLAEKKHRLAGYLHKKNQEVCKECGAEPENTLPNKTCSEFCDKKFVTTCAEKTVKHDVTRNPKSTVTRHVTGDLQRKVNRMCENMKKCAKTISGRTV